MTIAIANIYLDGVTSFDTWRVRTNEIADALSTKVVTVNADPTVGDAVIDGSVQTTSLYVTNVYGGAIGATGTLTFQTNVDFAATVSAVDISLSGTLSVLNESKLKVPGSTASNKHLAFDSTTNLPSWVHVPSFIDGTRNDNSILVWDAVQSAYVVENGFTVDSAGGLASLNMNLSVTGNITSSAKVTANNIDILNGLTINGSSGTAGYALITDGVGGVSWASVSDASTLSGKSLWSSGNNFDVITYTDSLGGTKVGTKVEFHSSDTVATPDASLTYSGGTLSTSSDFTANTLRSSLSSGNEGGQINLAPPVNVVNIDATTDLYMDAYSDGATDDYIRFVYKKTDGTFDNVRIRLGGTGGVLAHSGNIGSDVINSLTEDTSVNYNAFVVTSDNFKVKLDNILLNITPDGTTSRSLAKSTSFGQFPVGSGTAVPANTVAEDGSAFILSNTDGTFSVYVKEAGVWTLKGGSGSGAGIHIITGAPASTLGNDGDIAIQTDAPYGIWYKNAGAWYESQITRFYNAIDYQTQNNHLKKNGVNLLHTSYTTGTDGDTNVFLGQSAGNDTVGSGFVNTYEGTRNIGIGTNALFSVTLGHENTFVGYNSGYSITTGAGNIGIGSQALNAETTGSNNIGIGQSALLAQNGASNNTGVGDNAGSAITTGSANTILGANAASDITTGANNTILGANVALGNVSNNIAFATGDGTVRFQYDGTQWKTSERYFWLTHSQAELQFDDSAAAGGALRRISCNDGGGNWNFRAGCYYNTTNAQLEYSTVNQAAASITVNHESLSNSDIILSSYVPNASGSAGSAIGEARKLSINSSNSYPNFWDGTAWQPVWHQGDIGNRITALPAATPANITGTEEVPISTGEKLPLVNVITDSIRGLTANTAPAGTEYVALDTGEKVDLNTIVGLASSGSGPAKWTSGALTVPNVNSSVSVAHSLPTATRVRAYVKCVVAEGGYVVGDIVELKSDGALYNSTIWFNTTTVGYSIYYSNSTIARKDGSNYIVLSGSANWEMYLELSE